MLRRGTKHHPEALEYLGAARRFIRSAGVRVANADEAELAALIDLHNTLDDAIAVAVNGQRAYGRSWAYIAKGAGTTKQAAWERWGEK